MFEDYSSDYSATPEVAADIAPSNLGDSNVWSSVAGGASEAPVDWAQMFDGSGLSGAEDGGALSQVLGGGSPNVGSVSDPEAMKLLGQSVPGTDKSVMGQLTNMLKDKEGGYDINKLVKLGLGLGSFLNSLGNKGKSQGAQTAAQLQAQLAQRNQQWTPQQSMWANQFFNTPTNFARPRQFAADVQSPIVAGRGYAEGGTTNIWDAARKRREQEAGLEDYTPQTLQPGTTRYIPAPEKQVPVNDLIRSIPLLLKSLLGGGEPEQVTPKRQYAGGGEVFDAATGSPVQDGPPQGPLSTPFTGYVQGDGNGQDDLIDAKLSRGEYVLDSDIVSALGDGSNDAGAEILDKWREFMRQQKRSAPSDEIPEPSGGMQALPAPGAQ